MKYIITGIIFLVAGCFVHTTAYPQKKLLILGSSTSACYNISYESCYASRLLKYFQDKGLQVTIDNRAVAGDNCYQGMPLSYVPPGGRNAPRPYNNITDGLAGNPDVVLVNYPSNGYDFFSVQEVMYCLRTIRQAAINAGKPCYITTTQPRSEGPSYQTAEARKKMADIKDSVLAEFGPFAIDFWNGIANPANNTILGMYDSGDGIHLNSAGHNIFFTRVIEKNIFDKPQAGLQYRMYTGDWNALPDFSTLSPVKTGASSNIDINVRPAGTEDHYGFVWEGAITVKTPGTYTFSTISDDGSKLYFNTLYTPFAAALVNNDGLHGFVQASGSTYIPAAGSYPIAITYFNKTGGKGISAYWSGPDFAQQQIPDVAFGGSGADLTPPGTPANLKVVSSGSSFINLDWDDAPDNVGVTVYDVYVNGTKTYSTAGSAVTVNNLAAGTSYQFFVIAYDQAGNGSAASAPITGITTANASGGLFYRVYLGDWNALPDFSALTPVKSGTSANVDINVRPAGMDEHYGMVWEGNISIKTPGTYTFTTVSDDGSKIYFNTMYSPFAAALVNNDGLHGFIQASGSTYIAAAGSYPIAITYFNKTGIKTGISVYWSGPDFSQQAIPDAAFSTGGSISNLLMPALPLAADMPAGVTAPGDVFTLQATATAAANTPVVAEWTTQAAPDEHVLLTGDKLDGTQTEARIYNGQFYNGAIPQMNRESGMVKMPAELPGYGMYVMWLKNSNGYGPPVTINKTKAFWMQKAGASGMTVFLVGKNLAYDNAEGHTNSYIYLKPQSGGSGQFATVTKVNPYRVEFTVPPGLAAGDYNVWAHNGHGGDYGWSEKLSLTILSTQDHVKTRNFGARYAITSYGAVAGNTGVDNAAAINAAASAASAAGGGIIYIPAGTYTVRSSLYSYEQVKYLGEAAADGAPASTLKLAGAFNAGPYGFYGYSLSTRNMIMWENITLDNTAGIDATGNSGSFLTLGNPNMMYWKNCRLLCKGYQPFRISDQSHNVFFEKVNFAGREIFMNGTEDIYFDRCDFKMTDASDGAFLPWSVKRFSVTNSTCSDYDGSTTGQGTRFICGNSPNSSSYYQYYERDTITGVGPQLTGGGDRNRGETFLWEGAETRYSALAGSATATTVTFSGASPSPFVAPPGGHITIGKGTGIGQTRLITANNGNGLITIDKPWNVVPDASSLCLTGTKTTDMTIYKNVIDASSKPYLVTDDLSMTTASAGVNFFASCSNNIFDGNTVTGTRTGIANMATEYLPPFYHPNMFNVFQNNTITGTRWAFLIQAYPERDEWTMPGTGVLCSVYRNNTLTNIIQDQVYYGVVRDRAYPDPSVSNIIFEHSRMNATAPRNLLRADWGYPPVALYPGTVTQQLFSQNYNSFY